MSESWECLSGRAACSSNGLLPLKMPNGIQALHTTTDSFMKSETHTDAQRPLPCAHTKAGEREREGERQRERERQRRGSWQLQQRRRHCTLSWQLPAQPKRRAPKRKQAEESAREPRCLKVNDAIQLWQLCSAAVLTALLQQ